MTLSVELSEKKAHLTKVFDNGEVIKTSLPRGAYDVMSDIEHNMRNKEVQYLLKARLGCSDGRASALIERFTPSYKAFSGIALLQGVLGGDNGRERMFVSATDGVAATTNMLTRRLNNTESLEEAVSE